MDKAHHTPIVKNITNALSSETHSHKVQDISFVRLIEPKSYKQQQLQAYRLCPGKHLQ